MAVSQHLRAMQGLGDRHEAVGYNAVDAPPAWLGSLGFDAVVLHTTFLCRRWVPHFDEFRNGCSWIAGLDVPKIALPQDDYDHAEVLDEWLAELGVTDVLCAFEEPELGILYPTRAGGARFERVLTGYVDDATRQRLEEDPHPLADRSFDVVYRATRLPYWFGSLGQLKCRVGELGRSQAAELGLRTDVSMDPRDAVLGYHWLQFLQSGRATLGSESGSSVLDRRGEIRLAVEAILGEEPGLTFDELSDRMPAGWDGYSFPALSPRHLEAASARTPQLLVEGSFAGVLEPEKHYIAIRRDFSNLREVLERVRDLEGIGELAERAHRQLVASGAYSYTKLATAVARAVSHNADGPGREGRSRPPLSFVHALAAGRAVLGRPLRRSRTISRALRSGGLR